MHLTNATMSLASNFVIVVRVLQFKRSDDRLWQAGALKVKRGCKWDRKSHLIK